ncbi:MAG: hypothetical protein ABI767_13175 [Rhodanobacter sp.]
MRAIHRLIGCTLCIVGIGSAAATTAETQDLGGSPQAVVDSSSASSVSSSGGDAMGMSRDCPTTSTSGNSGGSSASGNDHSSGGAVAPSPSHRPHLGWQSLLPGSIQ